MIVKELQHIGATANNKICFESAIWHWKQMIPFQILLSGFQLSSVHTQHIQIVSVFGQFCWIYFLFLYTIYHLFTAFVIHVVSERACVRACVCVYLYICKYRYHCGNMEGYARMTAPILYRFLLIKPTTILIFRGFLSISFLAKWKRVQENVWYSRSPSCRLLHYSFLCWTNFFFSCHTTEQYRNQ